MQKQKGFVILLVVAVVAVAVLGTAGYLVYQNYATEPTNQQLTQDKQSEDQNTQDLNTESSDLPNQAAGPALSEAEGWKTYTNSQYGFELQYPSTLTSSEYTDQGFNKFYLSLKKDSVPVFSFNVTQENFNQYISGLEKSSGWDEGYNFCENVESVIDKTEDIIFSGLNAKKVTLNKCVTLRGPVNYSPDKNFVYIFIPKDGQSYIVVLSPAIYMYGYDKISDTLLSTFKFTK